MKIRSALRLTTGYRRIDHKSLEPKVTLHSRSIYSDNNSNRPISILDWCNRSSLSRMAAEVPIRAACMGVDCPNDAGSLKCPNCLKIGKESSFCSQDCFKRSWVGHVVPS